MAWILVEERQWIYWTKDLNLELPGRRKRGTPQRSFTDVVKVDIQRVGRTEEDIRNRVRRRQVISCENPKGAAKRRRACLNISEKADIL